MKTAIVPLSGGSYEYRSKGVSPQRTVNFYPEATGAGAKANPVLVKICGEAQVATIGDDATASCRRLYYSSTGPDGLSTMYGCYGNSIYRIELGDDGWSYTFIGQVQTGTVVTITDNGFVGVVTDGVALYAWDLDATNDVISTTWRQVDLPILNDDTELAPTTCEFMNYRIIVNSGKDGQFWYSELPTSEEPIAFEQLNFYTAENSADILTTLKVVEGLLWLFGPRSYELWGAGDPFVRLLGTATDVGVQAPRSVASIGPRVFWLGASDAGTNSVYMGSSDASDTRPKAVSDPAIEHIIGGLSDPAGGVGWCYSSETHIFYVLTFPADNITIVYDASTGLWHNRASRNWETGLDEAWTPIYAVAAYGKLYHGSTTDNALIELTQNSYTDRNGNPIIAYRRSQIFWASLNPVTIRELAVDCDTGTATDLSGYAKTPSLLLLVSRDGGYTWIPYPSRSIGAQGTYGNVVKWNNLGRGRSLAIQITQSDPIPFTLSQCRITTEEAIQR